MLKVQTKVLNDYMEIKKHLQSVWGNSIFKQDEFAALKDFENNKKFTDDRYEVSLTFKENHDILPDHYGTSVHRLKGLLKKV